MKLKIINWKTTLGAVMVVLANFLGAIGITLSGEVQTALITVGIFIIGIFAKDKNVSDTKKEV